MLECKNIPSFSVKFYVQVLVGERIRENGTHLMADTAYNTANMKVLATGFCLTDRVYECIIL